jgi:hypothetical protein
MGRLWRCRACGKVFKDEGLGAPKEHGDFYYSQDGVKQDICKGTLELLPDSTSGCLWHVD